LLYPVLNGTIKREFAKEPDMAEKRNLKRRELLYNLKVLDDETGELIGYAVDISAQGLKFSSSQDFEPGRRLELSLELPHEILGKRSVKLIGNVKWCSPDINPELRAAGVRFSSISSDDEETLVALMAQFSFV
jgi:hypothetical protein